MKSSMEGFAVIMQGQLAASASAGDNVAEGFGLADWLANIRSQLLHNLVQPGVAHTALAKRI